MLIIINIIFTSFVAVLLLLAMVYNEFCYITCAIHGKNSLLCILDWLTCALGELIGYGYSCDITCLE